MKEVLKKSDMIDQKDVGVLKASNKSDFNCWKELCNSAPDCDVYFYPQYALVYELNNEGEAIALVYKRNKKDFILYPFLKRKIDQAYLCEDLGNEYFDIVSPYGYVGYYRSSECSIDTNTFYNAVKTFCKKNYIVSEFVRFNPWMETQKNCKTFMDTSLLQQVVAINLLKSEDEIWKNYSSKIRNRIRKNIKNGVIIEEDEPFAFIDDFCRLYYQTMNRNKASRYYYFDKEFYLNLKRFLNGHVKLHHAFIDRKIIGSLMIINSRKYSHAHLSCMDMNYSDLSPLTLLVHQIALQEKNEGRTHFILGGGRTSDTNDTLLRFKKRFSKTLYDFYIGSKIHNKKRYHNLCKKKIEYERKQRGVKFNEMFFPRYRAPEIR